LGLIWLVGRFGSSEEEEEEGKNEIFQKDLFGLFFVVSHVFSCKKVD
jgi:hypothetical protein